MAGSFSTTPAGPSPHEDPWAVLRLAEARRLLAAEKRRRGVPPRQLVFVGINNVADVWWCAAKAVRKAHERELAYFQMYLADRLSYSRQLGRLKHVPRRHENWLTIGDDLTLDDINDLLDAHATEAAKADRSFVAHARDGVLYVDPALAADRHEFCAEWAARMGWTLASVEQDPKLWAEMVGARRAERYPTIRWNFPWESYVLIGVPDGLTRSLVYDFRVARNADVARRFVKPVAMTQADLLGLCFHRDTKRVQVCVLKTEKVSTIEAPVDPARGMETLRIFKAVDAGKPAGPPASWKCAASRCEYAESCRVCKPSDARPSEAKLPPLAPPT